MANRHLSRSIVLQTLFEWDFTGGDMEKTVIALARNVEEFAPGMGKDSFTSELIGNILNKQKSLDAIIEKAAPDWPLDKISIVDRNVLRIGLYELVYGDKAEVPAKVAINEAIELAKTFGGDNSGRFVNGVLGAVYKEMGEPGKDETSTKRKKFPPVDYENMPIELLVGCIVYAREGDDVYLGLVHDVFGRWTLSKGHVTEDEKAEEAVVRVVEREMGVTVEVKEKIGDNEYIASHPEKGKLRKQVIYFLAEAPHEELTVEEKKGLDDAKWFKLAEIIELNMYDDILPIVTKAINILLGNKESN